MRKIVLAPTSGTPLAAPAWRLPSSQVKEVIMPVAKIIEITAESNQSFEDAIRDGITTAAKTIHNIRNAWVKEQQVVVADNKITSYRVDLKITFVVD
jgi:flavin-binding protein dodecin